MMPASAMSGHSSAARDEIVLSSPAGSPPSVHRGMGARNRSLGEIPSLGSGGVGGSTHGHHPYRDARGEYHSHHGTLLHDRDREAMSLNEMKDRDLKELQMRERDKERSNGHASATSSPSPGIPYSRPLSSSSIEGRIRSGDSSRAPSPNGTSSSHTQTAHSG